MTSLLIRPAQKNDCEIIHQFIIKLAKVEKFPFKITVTPQDIEDNLFGNLPVARGLIFCIDNQPIGFAIYYFTFSTCLGKNGLHLEDLYFEPEFHVQGYGKQVMKYLAKLAINKGCARFEWWVVNTNEPAIKFYQKLGAKKLDELSIFRLAGDELNGLSGL